VLFDRSGVATGPTGNDRLLNRDIKSAIFQQQWQNCSRHRVP